MGRGHCHITPTSRLIAEKKRRTLSLSKVPLASSTSEYPPSKKTASRTPARCTFPNYANRSGTPFLAHVRRGASPFAPAAAQFCSIFAKRKRTHGSPDQGCNRPHTRLRSRPARLRAPAFPILRPSRTARPALPSRARRVPVPCPFARSRSRRTVP